MSPLPPSHIAHYEFILAQSSESDSSFSVALRQAFASSWRRCTDCWVGESMEFGADIEIARM